MVPSTERMAQLKERGLGADRRARSEVQQNPTDELAREVSTIVPLQVVQMITGVSVSKLPWVSDQALRQVSGKFLRFKRHPEVIHCFCYVYMKRINEPTCAKPRRILRVNVLKTVTLCV